MASLVDIDLRNIEVEESFKPLPAGKYRAMIIESSERERNKKGTGDYVCLTISILDGEYRGRTVREYLNLWHSNETTRDIAHRTIVKICNSVGIFKGEIKHTNELHDKPFEITLGVGNPNSEGKVYNEIKGYSPISNEKQPEQPQQQAPGQKQSWM